ncbi:hypothetical protein HLH17_14940 [Acinetobacter sp. ANC 5380]|uniref:Uncharacterized protein n=1 Tax=Acinetobacter terrae TaxID=2731247 RepID=A0A7Y2RHI5_9GAMM|nr:hypothetical protein [Acinetobacter terrae]NNH78917.1 hypothetical protein [Acinetobacter terrae]
MKFSKILIIAASTILGFSSQTVFAKTASCEIIEQGKTTFKNKCNFEVFGGGSFYLTNLDTNKPLVRNVMDVTVHVVETGFAEVTGSLKGGNNSRWGKAKRSGACWVGSDFKVCAR